jgi:thioredoxin 1
MSTIDIGATNIDDTIAASEIVIIDWWADWCGPCKAFAPTYEKASETNPDITFAKIDTDIERDLSAAAGIQSIPTLMIFREGSLVYRESGSLNPDNFDRLIDAVRNLDMDEVRREQAEAKEIMRKQKEAEQNNS